MRIAFITAGAAGMFCGSCLRDNTLVGALNRIGHDALLIPTYTPIRTDEVDQSVGRVFFGGINVYLQQKSRLFRHTPWLTDRLLDFPRLLRWVSRFAARTPYSELGSLTVSMLRGDHGYQKKEVAKLVDYLKSDVKPEVVILTNALLSGIIPHLKQDCQVPIFVTLQGDDIFLDALPENDRNASIELIAQNLTHADGTISTSRYYADYMQNYLRLGTLASHVIYPGIHLKGHGSQRPIQVEPPHRIGYFARIAPEKGFHLLVDAFIALRKAEPESKTRLMASGWLGENHHSYFNEQILKLSAAGLASEFEYVPSPDHPSKVRFLQSIDLLCVPTTYREPKGLYVLEAWANGVPVVLPAHGTFPELIERTEAGLLVPPGDTAVLARTLQELLNDHDRRQLMGERGYRIVRETFAAEHMATNTVLLLSEHLRNRVQTPVD